MYSICSCTHHTTSHHTTPHHTTPHHTTPLHTTPFVDRGSEHRLLPIRISTLATSNRVKRPSRSALGGTLLAVPPQLSTRAYQRIFFSSSRTRALALSLLRALILELTTQRSHPASRWIRAPKLVNIPIPCICSKNKTKKAKKNPIPTSRIRRSRRIQRNTKQPSIPSA